MKYIILIIILISGTNLLSQDKEAIPLRFKFENKSGFHPFNIEDYPQDFLRGILTFT